MAGFTPAAVASWFDETTRAPLSLMERNTCRYVASRATEAPGMSGCPNAGLFAMPTVFLIWAASFVEHGHEPTPEHFGYVNVTTRRSTVPLVNAFTNSVTTKSQKSGQRVWTSVQQKCANRLATWGYQHPNSYAHDRRAGRPVTGHRIRRAERGRWPRPRRHRSLRTRPRTRRGSVADRQQHGRRRHNPPGIAA